MQAKLFLLCVTVAAMVPAMPSHSQTPAPVVVPASSPAPQVIQPAATVDATTAANIKMLRDLKAANEETLKKQKAALQTLDGLQKEADQIKIFAARA